MPARRDTMGNLGRTLLAVLTLTLAAGCSFQKAKTAFKEQRYEDAVREYREILKKDPSSVEAKIGYQRSATLASEQHLEKAKGAQKRGMDEMVYAEVRKAVVLDPNNAAASEWLAQLELAAQKKKAQLDAEESVETSRAKAEAKPISQLNPRSLEGLDLNFSTRQSLKEIFKVISKASGVNIIAHTSFPQDLQVSVDLRGLSFQRILDTLMLQNDLQYRVIDANTIMVYRDQPQLKDKFENQLIQTFYLSNAEVEVVRDTLTRLINGVKVFPDKRLNAIIVKAKPSDLITAKRIVNQLDKPKSEVMIYLELMEVTESSMEQVGLLPVMSPGETTGVYRIGATIDGGGGMNQNKGAIRINAADVKYLFPSLALDALKSSGNARLVASPNIRVLSGETGEINIGQKVSVTQSSMGVPSMGGTTGSTGTTGSMPYGFGQTQFNYEDVGVKIKLKPRVHQNSEITIEIDSKVTTLISGNKVDRPDIGMREIKTFTRLKDGETAVFGGLLKEDEQKSLQGIWGLTDIPVIGKLLGNTHRQRAKTDVILTIRAVLLRGPGLREDDFEAYDPDLETSREGPFAPKPANTPKPADTPKPVVTPAPMAPPVPPRAPEVPKANVTPVTPEATPTPPQAPQPVPVATPQASNFVIFLSPVAPSTITQGNRFQIALLVNGGKGVSSGAFELQADPKLKIHSVSPGEFLTEERGSIDMDFTPSSEGITKLNFKRQTTHSDRGTLAILEVEGLSKGKAPMVVQSIRYLMDGNPVPYQARATRDTTTAHGSSYVADIQTRSTEAAMGQRPDNSPTTPMGRASPTEAYPASAPGPPASPAIRTANDLVVFISPTTATITKGGRLQMAMLVSGGKNISSGTLELRVDPRLKVHSISPGDFLTAEAGGLEQNPGTDGVIRLFFKRRTAGSDSGTLAILELEGLTKGNAPLMIQSGRYLIDTTPIAGRVVNALVVVE